MRITVKNNFNFSDLEGNQGWWEDHRKSQGTPDLLEDKKKEERKMSILEKSLCFRLIAIVLSVLMVVPVYASDSTLQKRVDNLEQSVLSLLNANNAMQKQLDELQSEEQAKESGSLDTWSRIIPLLVAILMSCIAVILASITYGVSSDSAYPAALILASALNSSDVDDDGILNDADQCPIEPGLQEDGCPTNGTKFSQALNKVFSELLPIILTWIEDPDGDGITGTDDDCPLEEGSWKLNGCPYAVN